jgi:hypothetical protein
MIKIIYLTQKYVKSFGSWRRKKSIMMDKIAFNTELNHQFCRPLLPNISFGKVNFDIHSVEYQYESDLVDSTSTNTENHVASLKKHSHLAYHNR